ncbi:hypothetical protein D3C73_992670 [compost metagenome]
MGPSPVGDKDIIPVLHVMHEQFEIMQRCFQLLSLIPVATVQPAPDLFRSSLLQITGAGIADAQIIILQIFLNPLHA